MSVDRVDQPLAAPPRRLQPPAVLLGEFVRPPVQRTENWVNFSYSNCSMRPCREKEEMSRYACEDSAVGCLAWRGSSDC